MTETTEQPQEGKEVPRKPGRSLKPARHWMDPTEHEIGFQVRIDHER
jgi:hypothetical protein